MWKIRGTNPVVLALSRSMAIIEFTPEGVILDANENFLKTTGYTLDEIRGKHHRLFCEKDHASSPEYEDSWRKIRAGEFLSGTFRRVSRTGAPLWLEATYNPIMGARGKPVKVVKVAQNITQQTMTAHDLKSRMNALDRSMAVIEFSTDGSILQANENFLKTVGYRADEIIGKHHRLFCESGYSRSPEYASFWKKLNKGEFVSGQFERRGKGGNVLWLEASYNPVFDADGRLHKVVKFASDITSRMRTAEADRQTATDLHQLAAETDTVVKDGAQVIETTVREMNHIASRAQSASSLITNLDEQTRKITSIVQTIHEIANQTNILAINAAIESARAGDQGRGFSVVAEEVRKLAARTQTSTREIATMIEAICKGTGHALTGIAEMMTQTQEGLTLANQAGVAIEQIRASNQEMTGLIDCFSVVARGRNGAAYPV